MKKAIADLMIKNRRMSGRYQYTVPSPSNYPYQWLWDSCFHAIILTHLDVEDAKKELLSLISHQFKNGIIPHMIYWDKAKPTDFPLIEWGRYDTSTITQPPMLAYAVLKIYSKSKDLNFLRKIYPQLKNFYNYLIRERDPRNNHLIGIINPDESGEDNSPRFDIPLGLKPKQSDDKNFQKRLNLVAEHLSCNFEIGTCMRNFFWVKDVPFNAIMMENLKNLAQLAKILREKEDGAYFEKQANLIGEAMRKLMFDEGIFWTTYGKDYKKIRVKTWAIFAPLFAKLYNKVEAEKLVDKYLLDENQFKTPFLIPTVAKDEPSFDPKGFWRGPVWISINWFIYHGLLNYGFQRQAEMILQNSLGLIEKEGFREYYHPQTGEGLGAKDFTWGGLVLDMV